MATPIEFSEIKQWVSINKNQTSKFNLPKEDPVKTTVQGWESQSIEPATPLSCILYLTDSMYTHIPVSGRHSLLREKCTELESSFTTILKGRKFPVRRTAEAIVAASTGGPNSSSTLGWNALCRLFEMQIVWFDEGQKLIQFYPEDVHTWSCDTPIHFISNLANQVWIPPSSWNSSNFINWLSNKENEKWRIKYNEADGTMEELKDLAKKVGYNANTRINKADLQKHLGRARAIYELGQWANN